MFSIIHVKNTSLNTLGMQYLRSCNPCSLWGLYLNRPETLFLL